MSGSLKPCPFCSGEVATVSDNARGLVFDVKCGRCRATGPAERCAADAATAWNQRASTAPLVEALEAFTSGAVIQEYTYRAEVDMWVLEKAHAALAKERGQ